MANFNGFNAHRHQYKNDGQTGQQNRRGKYNRNNRYNANTRYGFSSTSSNSARWNQSAGSFSHSSPNFSVPPPAVPGPPEWYSGSRGAFAVPPSSFSCPPLGGSDPFSVPPSSFSSRHPFAQSGSGRPPSLCTGPPPIFPPTFSVPLPSLPSVSNAGAGGRPKSKPNSGPTQHRSKANSGTGQPGCQHSMNSERLYSDHFISDQQTFSGSQNGSQYQGTAQSKKYEPNNSKNAQFGGRHPVNCVWSDRDLYTPRQGIFPGPENYSGNEYGRPFNHGRGQNKRRRRKNRNNNESNNNSQNNGNLNETGDKKKEKVDKRDLPENNKHVCEVCDRGYKTEEKYEEHVSQHTQCWVNGCRYVAAPKLVQLHYNTQHKTGVAKKIWTIHSPEEIKKWIEERKRNYPTKENIARKAQEREERRKRGEVLEDKTRRFGKFGRPMGRARRGRYRGRGRGFRGQNGWGGDILERSMQSALDMVTEECQSKFIHPPKRPWQAEDDGSSESSLLGTEVKKGKLDDAMNDSTEREGQRSACTVSSEGEDTSSDSESNNTDDDSNSNNDYSESVKNTLGEGLSSLVAAYKASAREDGEISDEEGEMCEESTSTSHTLRPGLNHEEKETSTEMQPEGESAQVRTEQQEESNDVHNRSAVSASHISQQEISGNMQLEAIASTSMTCEQEEADQTQNWGGASMTWGDMQSGAVASTSMTCEQEEADQTQNGGGASVTWGDMQSGAVASTSMTCEQEEADQTMTSGDVQSVTSGDVQSGAVAFKMGASQQETTSQLQSGDVASEGRTSHEEKSCRTPGKGRTNGREPVWKTKVRRLRNQKYRRNNIILGTLLKDDIRHERNVLLQCVHYMVRNNFLGVLNCKATRVGHTVCKSKLEAENEQTINCHSD